MKQLTFIVCALVLSCCVHAEVSFPSEYYAIASYSGVPADILYAVALAESGRGAGQQRRPHPWTLNIAGEPHYYDSRERMFDALMGALGSGRTNVDIGPLQLNWHWQYQRLLSPWQATEPFYNLKVAAGILAGHYARDGDWVVAIGKYHRAASGEAHEAAARAYSARVTRIMRALK